MHNYQRAFSDTFKTYRKYHCKNTIEQKELALSEYSIDHIKRVHREIIPIIERSARAYEEQYNLVFPISVQLIVGVYGSNAYAEREVVPNITFALEQLPADKESLSIIVAHELGHVAHHMLTDQKGCDWRERMWHDPRISAFQEGAAMHFSKQIVTGLPHFMYFSFDAQQDDGYNKSLTLLPSIARAFLHDLQQESSTQMVREWFSIRGGKQFQIPRLGYVIGEQFVATEIGRLGEERALTLWTDPNFLQFMNSWLEEVCENEFKNRS
ncbi:hypothetical protein [Geomicrobium sp. JCM 19039]|uniref:hypothetical protein n=1 Tax=Geomicrobium sp. JCM 19039 TaxID=1460636 RepID=UPI00045F261D|nr:hypothetical protein [Geomicrobium sp. JCM 19039]GAK13168.1 hypothetical protein JCM19039_2992 [Geomicrobium sp. JCM 19039]